MQGLLICVSSLIQNLDGDNTRNQVIQQRFQDTRCCSFNQRTTLKPPHRLQLEDNQTRDFKVPPGGVAAPTITPTPLLSWIQLWVKRAPRQCYLSATYSSKTVNPTLDITRHGTIPPPPPLSHSKTLRCPWPLTLSASSWSIFSTSMVIAKHQFHCQLIQSLGVSPFDQHSLDDLTPSTEPLNPHVHRCCLGCTLRRSWVLPSACIGLTVGACVA